MSTLPTPAKAAMAGTLADWRQTADVQLKSGSPAINAGAALPEDWPDPLRQEDPGQPDIGAIPFGAASLQVGPK